MGWRERVFIIGHLRGTRRREVFPIRESNNKNIIQFNNQNDSSNRLFEESGITLSLTAREGDRPPKIAVPVLTPHRPEKRQKGRRFKENGEPAFTLTSQDRHGVYDGNRIRRLTVVECERLQGFPDGWTEGLSDSQRYKCLGNAVTTNVITAIMSKLIISEEKGL
jgi:DNA (cytosine-5)-methyltransferase 1